MTKHDRGEGISRLERLRLEVDSQMEQMMARLAREALERDHTTKELRLEGIVRSRRYPEVILECSDGWEWVISYSDQSPYRAFNDHRVVVSGKPYKPSAFLPYRIKDGQPVPHLRILMMQLVEPSPDAKFVEVKGWQKMSGRFERITTDSGESTLSFGSETGETYLVANDPTCAKTGSDVEVLTYAVELPPSTAKGSEQYLWIGSHPDDLIDGINSWTSARHP